MQCTTLTRRALHSLLNLGAALGSQQLLLGETVAQAGAMNLFAVFEHPDRGE
jgi:hypothetical protein